jgi:hypothetical protein
LMLSNLVPSSARPSYERVVNFLVPASAVGEVSR